MLFLYLVDGIILAGITVFFIHAIWHYRKFRQQVKAWDEEDRRFLDTLENIEMVMQSDMSQEERREAVLSLYEGYQQAKQD